MTPRPSHRSPVLSRAAGAFALAAVLGLTACTAAGPPKAPPPPIQDSSRQGGTGAAPAPGAAAAPAAAGAQAASPAAAAPASALPPRAGPAAAPAAAVPAPTPPAVITEAIAAAPPPPGEPEPDELPSGRELATGTIAALSEAKSARLSARLATGNRTELVYIAPDRAALVEQNSNGQETARFVIIGSSGYTNVASTGTGWQQVTNDDFRKQAQIFRPIQIALATGQARVLESGTEVELVEENGKPALRAIFEYGSSAELQDLGLMRSGTNLLEIVVDPTTWLPIRSREETQGSVTEVTYLEFDQPVAIEPPIS
jgi:hypothetical protein